MNLSIIILKVVLLLNGNVCLMGHSVHMEENHNELATILETICLDFS